LPKDYNADSADIDDSSIKTIEVNDSVWDDPETTQKKLILPSAKSMSFDESKWSVSSHSQVKRNRDKKALTITDTESAFDSHE